MAKKVDAQSILASHRITLKSVRRRNGTVDQYYSIQFTYPKGSKQQFTGASEQEVREKVYTFFNVSLLTFKGLYEMWQADSDLSESEEKKMKAARYGFKRYVYWLGDKIVADVTPEDILEAGKKHISSGCKTGSANTQIRNIGHMYEYGIRKGIVNSNPALSVKRFRIQENAFERNYLSDRQICEFLNNCEAHKEYMFAAFFICGIDRDRFIPLRWKDINFENNRISIHRRMESRRSFNIVKLERTEDVALEEPGMAFNCLKLELEKQANNLDMPKEELMKSDRPIITHPGSDKNTSSHAFGLRLDNFLRRKTHADYKMGDIFFTSAVYAFKAECDMPSVASIIGYKKTIEMFRNPENYDLLERKKSRSVNDYFDELYYGRQE